jgi:hypothetical protein
MTKNILDAVLGLEPGESVPMMRHGEMGMLYRPIVQLSMEEWGLYSELWVAWGERDLGGRDNVVALLQSVAQTSKFVTPETMHAGCEHVMRYIDELACMHSAGNE